ncbi:MAG: hypothetical protein JO096_05805 [Alphaproteobacteria bacterium]|nr:hypothetical protein [Alphaproteobacteria bacterium]
MTISRALAYLGLVGLGILLLWLTLRVDLVIFGGVLFAVSLRRAAETLSRLTRLPVGRSLLAVVLLILAFFSAVGCFFRRPSPAKSSSFRSSCRRRPTKSER